MVANTARWQVEKDLGGALRAVDVSKAPAVGFMRVNPDDHTQGVYERTDPFNVSVRVFAKARSGKFKLSWDLLAYNRGMDTKSYDTVLESSSTKFTLKEGAKADLELPLTKHPERDAYRLRLKLEHGGGLIDRYEYTLGVRTDFSTPLKSRVGRSPSRHDVKKKTYYQTTFHHPSYALPKTLEEDLRGFGEYLD
jgi:hypothetical protein